MSFLAKNVHDNRKAVNNIVLRADSVGSAVQALLTTAAATETITNQYRVGLYPFISQMGTLYAISNNLTAAQTAAGTLGSLLDIGLDDAAAALISRMPSHR